MYFLCLDPEELPTFLQNPDIATIVLHVKAEMPAVLIEWNDNKFNDNINVPGCRNRIEGQTKDEIIANLITNGMTNHHDVLFTFQNDRALSAWINNIRVNLPW